VYEVEEKSESRAAFGVEGREKIPGYLAHYRQGVAESQRLICPLLKKKRANRGNRKMIVANWRREKKGKGREVVIQQREGEKSCPPYSLAWRKKSIRCAARRKGRVGPLALGHSCGEKESH